MSKRRVLLLCLITALVAVTVTAGTCFYFIYTGPIGKVFGIVNLLDQSYYRPVDREKALEGASRGVVTSLGDPYSSYMSRQEWEEFQVRTSGAYSGIGVTIDVRDKYVRIATPMKGSPAEEAGLRADDLILRVDGEPVATSDEAAAKIRGPAGTSVTLTIGRDQESFDVTITRRDIVVPASSYSMKEGGIGYFGSELTIRRQVPPLWKT